MTQRKLDRRAFLKTVLASAAAAGLSHFRILNFGASDAAAQDLCDPPSLPDTCIPQGSPPDPDSCYPPGDTDYCVPAGMVTDPDYCDPQYNEMDVGCAGEQDYCYPDDFDPDVCLPPYEADECLPATGDVDYQCTAAAADVCDPGMQDPDLCAPWAGETDVCVPGADEPDEPTVSTVVSLDASSAVSVLPAAGAAAAALGAAALRKLRTSEEDAGAETA